MTLKVVTAENINNDTLVITVKNEAEEGKAAEQIESRVVTVESEVLDLAKVASLKLQQITNSEDGKTIYAVSDIVKKALPVISVDASYSGDSADDLSFTFNVNISGATNKSAPITGAIQLSSKVASLKNFTSTSDSAAVISTDNGVFLVLKDYIPALYGETITLTAAVDNSTGAAIDYGALGAVGLVNADVIFEPNRALFNGI